MRLGSLNDLLVGTPVVEHVVKGLLSVDLLPSEASVAGLAHFSQQLIQLLTSVAVNVDGIDEYTILE